MRAAGALGLCVLPLDVLAEITNVTFSDVVRVVPAFADDVGAFGNGFSVTTDVDFEFGHLAALG